MIVDYLDDDENVKMMRDTARRVGLTDLLVSIRALNLMPFGNSPR